MQTFYIVWRPESRNPMKKHPTFNAACDEAERLAKLQPECDFHVLSSCSTMRGTAIVKTTHHDLEPK